MERVYLNKTRVHVVSFVVINGTFSSCEQEFVLARFVHSNQLPDWSALLRMPDNARKQITRDYHGNVMRGYNNEGIEEFSIL